MQKAIQRYVSTMEFYERNKYILQRGRENNTSYSTKTFNKRKSFMEYLTAAVDHKKAIKNGRKQRVTRILQDIPCSRLCVGSAGVLRVCH